MPRTLGRPAYLRCRMNEQGDGTRQPFRYVQLDRVIVDRGSVFTATLFPASSTEDVRRHLADLTRSKHFRFASHNVVAYRLRGPDGQLVEHKDDGYSGRVGGRRRRCGRRIGSVCCA